MDKVDTKDKVTLAESTNKFPNNQAISNPSEYTKEYTINKAKNLEKIAKNAIRPNIEREDKGSSCTTLIFSSGAYYKVSHEQ